MTAARTRHVEHEIRTVPADGSTLVDPRLGYLIAGFTRAGDVARPGEDFDHAMWSRDLGGQCSHGAHDKCAHRAGGPHECGQAVTGDDGVLHVWRCGCDCHGYAYEAPPALPVGQLELFAVAS